MTTADIDGDEVLGWPSRRRLDARTVFKDDLGRVISQTTPVLEQEGLITPTAAWYIVQHLGVPDPIHPFEWTLKIDGAVERPIELSFDQLRELGGRTERVLLECSGSDANYFVEGADDLTEAQESARKRQQQMGRTRANGMLLSAGEFTGVPLAAILELAGVRSDAVSVRLEGSDFGTPNSDVEPFFYDKALPMNKALDPDTLIAWALNGEYLDHMHGAPARAVVPGWSGNWHVKWLQRIEVLDHPGECWYQTEYYVYGESLENHEEMVTAVPVKSMVTFPGPDGTTLPRGRQVIRGLAWSGAGRVTQVEVSLDGGTSWEQAILEPPADRWMWVRWSLSHDFDDAGQFVIQARATDEDGRVQGTDPRYEDRAKNFLIKNYAGIVPVPLTISD